MIARIFMMHIELHSQPIQKDIEDRVSNSNKNPKNATMSLKKLHHESINIHPDFLPVPRHVYIVYSTFIAY